MRKKTQENVFCIKNKKWKIEFKPTGDEYLIMHKAPCIAQLFKQTRTIYFDENLLKDYEELRETLTHELVHAFIMTYAISHKQFRDEEFICEFIAVYGQDIISLANDLIDKLNLQDK